MEMDQLVVPDVTAIAKDGDAGELVKLVQLVLGCLVKNENNQYYIANIMQLGAQAQAVLMNIIGEVRSASLAAVPALIVVSLTSFSMNLCRWLIRLSR